MKEINEHITILIAKYLEKNTTEDEIKQLQKWIHEDENHKKHFLKVRELWFTTHLSAQHHTIDIIADEKLLWKKINHTQVKQKNILDYFYRVAAVLLLPLLCLSGYLLLKQQNENTPVTLQEIIAPPTGQTKMTLPDGSEVWLNAGSKISFQIPMTQRSVKLIGEGYFKVTSDKDNPFVVNVKKAKIKVTGTEFNVTAFENDTTTSVTLVHGKVDVKIKGYKNVTLGVGERLEIYDTQIKRQTLNNLYKWYAWKDGILVFRDDRLDYVFQRIERTYNVKIIVQDQEISSYLYRATFKEESLEQIFALLKLSAPINYKWVKRNQTNNLYEKQTIVVMKKGGGNNG